MRYANWSPATCRKQLKTSKLDVKRHRGPAKGIANPLRITGPIHGVQFKSPPPKVNFGLLDCRLLFALDQFAAVLEQHDVVGVRIDNYYRNRAKLPGKRKKSQHAYGLAADIVSFTLKDGRELDIGEDWFGEIGKPSCGPNAELKQTTDKAILLRNIMCDVARRGIFHHILTPNFNRAHRDHVHVDIKRDNKWFSID